MRPIFAIAEDIPFVASAADFERRQLARMVLRAIALAIIVLSVYLPSLDGKFLHADVKEVTLNLSLRTTSGLGRIWTRPAQASPAHPSNGPLSYTLLWCEYQMWGARSDGYRLVSVLLHVAMALLTWLLLRRLRVPGAWLGAAAFALHPVQVQTVAWLAQQADVLASTLFMGSGLLFLRFARLGPPERSAAELAGSPDHTTDVFGDEEEDAAVGRWRRAAGYAASMLLFILAVLSKPSAACLPLVLLSVILWRRKRASAADLRALAPFAVIGIVAAAAAWMTSPAQVEGGLADRFALLGQTIVITLGKLAFPYPLLIAYPNMDPRHPSWWAYAAPLAAVALLVGLWSARGRIGSGPLAAFAYFFIVLVAEILFPNDPGSQFAPVRHHSAYLAALGPLALAAAALVRLAAAVAKRVSSEFALPALRLTFGIALVMLLAWPTLLQANAFADEPALWRAVASHDPSWTPAYRELAWVYMARGEPESAEAHLQTALRRGPQDVETLTELARVFEAQGRWPEAGRFYREALSFRPDDPDLLCNVARSYSKLGSPQLALFSLNRALAQRPNDADIHNEIGLRLAELGRPAEAAGQYREALKLKPDLLSAKLNLATAYYRLGRIPDAGVLLQEVIQVDPTNAEAFLINGVMLAELNQLPRAARMFKVAVRLDPRSAPAWYNYGACLYKMDQMADAQFALGRAVELEPGNASYREHLKAVRETIQSRRGGGSGATTRSAG